VYVLKYLTNADAGIIYVYVGAHLHGFPILYQWVTYGGAPIRFSMGVAAEESLAAVLNQ